VAEGVRVVYHPEKWLLVRCQLVLVRCAHRLTGTATARPRPATALVWHLVAHGAVVQDAPHGAAKEGQFLFELVQLPAHVGVRLLGGILGEDGKSFPARVRQGPAGHSVHGVDRVHPTRLQRPHSRVGAHGHDHARKTLFTPSLSLALSLAAAISLGGLDVRVLSVNA